MIEMRIVMVIITGMGNTPEVGQLVESKNTNPILTNLLFSGRIEHNIPNTVKIVFFLT